MPDNLNKIVQNYVKVTRLYPNQAKNISHHIKKYSTEPYISQRLKVRPTFEALRGLSILFTKLRSDIYRGVASGSPPSTGIVAPVVGLCLETK